MVSRGRLRVKGYFQRTPVCLCFMFALFSTSAKIFVAQEAEREVVSQIVERKMQRKYHSKRVFEKAGLRWGVFPINLRFTCSFKSPVCKSF